MDGAFVLNDSAQYFDHFGSDCAKCSFLNEKEFTCRAFPVGIPIPILSGKETHREVKYGQKNNILFLKMARKDKYERLQAETVFLLHEWEETALRSEPGENGRWFAKKTGREEVEVLYATDLVNEAILEWNEISEREYLEF